MSPYVRRRLALSNVTQFQWSQKVLLFLKSCQLFVILGKSEISKSDNLMQLVCFWIVHLHKRTFNRGFQGENLIPCGGSLVYFKDICSSPIGKFLFTSVVIHSLVCVWSRLVQRRAMMFLILLGFRRLHWPNLKLTWVPRTPSIIVCISSSQKSSSRWQF